MNTGNSKQNNAEFKYEPLSNSYIFSDETLKSLNELGDVLRNIHNRLISEGYTISNGEIKKIDIIKY